MTKQEQEIEEIADITWKVFEDVIEPDRAAKKILSLIERTHVRKDTEVRVECFHLDVRCPGFIIKTVGELAEGK